MKRKIIEVEQAKCNGCGDCIPNCPEGALQIIDGKVRLISDLFCDGLGECIGTCPTGAMKIVEREAEPYDEIKVMKASIIPQGKATVIAHLKHLKNHGEKSFYAQGIEALKNSNINLDEILEAMEKKKMACGCPGSMARFGGDQPQKNETTLGTVATELRQWPIQLQLLNPDAPYLENSDLLIAADCTAFAEGDFHRKFMKGKIAIILCPKLDQDIERYIDKLADIFENKHIKSVTVARMEVPCCGGTVSIVERALQKAKVNLPINTQVLKIRL